MNGVSCQMSISISFQSKLFLNGNAMVDNDSWLDLTKKKVTYAFIVLIRSRGVSDVGFSIFADTDADFAFYYPRI